ncbi:P-selectin-like isoform X2 [Salarias fasciatus]|uniref:P-selectin-like isoform X2 n=1 Tax=Salarias fasciatus TaxID=181472 RepID=UPI001176C560|nr:P-selectin-like isoform X2 [Salarias fasciatus]
MDGQLVLFMLLSGLCFLPACFPHKYFLIEKAKTWSEALDYCRERYSDLAVVQNAEEMEQVVEVSQKYFQRRVWIGPRHEPSNWTWSGGRVGAEFEMWAEDEPNDHTEGKDNCVIARDGFWHDVPCSDEEHFACKSVESDSERSRTDKNSEADLDEAA